MAIEKFLEGQNGASLVFDPVPSYRGDWLFEIANLITNAKIENNKNLFQEFYHQNYENELIKIFDTKAILDFNVRLISKPKENNIGRTLRYNKADFYIELCSFLNGSLDRYGKSEEEANNYLKELISHIKEGNDAINAAFSEALRLKGEKIKTLIEDEINSEYFEAAMQDYAPYKREMEFKDYLTMLYDNTTKFQNGILKLDNFFDRDIDYKALYNCFSPDKFFLLFAKIIYEVNLNSEKLTHELHNSHSYLFHYHNLLTKMLKEDANYFIKVTYIKESGQKIRYTSRQFVDDYEKLMAENPEVKKFYLSNIATSSGEEEKYKDISLMEKINRLFNDDINVNWKSLLAEEKIPKSMLDTKDIKDVNMRIDILNHSGFVSKPLKGLNNLNGYYAFIYPNGVIVLEKFWEDNECNIPAQGYCSYVMNIDNFTEMSKTPNIVLDEYFKTLSNDLFRRIYHTSINNWQRNIYNEINGTYRLEDALQFMHSNISEGQNE